MRIFWANGLPPLWQKIARTTLRLVIVVLARTYCRRQRGYHFLQFPNLKASLLQSLMIAAIKKLPNKQ